MLHVFLCLDCISVLTELLGFFQVLHSAGVGHSPVWTTAFQECHCQWARPGEAGAFFLCCDQFLL